MVGGMPSIAAVGAVTGCDSFPREHVWWCRYHQFWLGVGQWPWFATSARECGCKVATFECLENLFVVVDLWRKAMAQAKAIPGMSGANDGDAPWHNSPRWWRLRRASSFSPSWFDFSRWKPRSSFGRAMSSILCRSLLEALSCGLYKPFFLKKTMNNIIIARYN
jgi:hypothetical protein